MKTSRTRQRLNPVVFALWPLLLAGFVLTGCATVGSKAPVNSPAGVKSEPHTLPKPEEVPVDDTAAAANEPAGDTESEAARLQLRAPISGSVLSRDAVRGETVTAEFTAPPPGRYEIVCSEFCGSGHAAMWAHVKVVDKAEFMKRAQASSGTGRRTSCVQ